MKLQRYSISKVLWKSKIMIGMKLGRLPWVESRGNLGISKTAAEKKLKSITLKLLDENKFEDYENVFNFWESTGIIEPINYNYVQLCYGHSEINIGYYLPHRAVIKDNSSTSCFWCFK